jgi:hypothetical protein
MDLYRHMSADSLASGTVPCASAPLAEVALRAPTKGRCDMNEMTWIDYVAILTQVIGWILPFAGAAFVLWALWPDD